MSIYNYSVEELKKKNINIKIDFDTKMLEEYNNILGDDINIINLNANVLVKVDKRSNLFFISGNIKATLNLKCVRELNFFNQSFDFNFNEEYSYTREDEISLTGDMMPIYIDGEYIDLAHVVFEELVIEIPNYPVSSCSKINDTDDIDVDFSKDKEKSNPFAILKKLKEK